MKTAIAVAIAVTVFCGLVLPSDAHAFLSGECEYLNLHLPDNYYFSLVNCTSGSAETVQQRHLVLKQGLMKPITCQISVSAEGHPSFSSGFHVHQNYCFYKGGNITLTHDSGSQPVYTSSEGSWSENHGGELNITSFNPP